MEQKVTIELTVNDINVILTGLGELPAKISIELIQKVKEQVLPQITTQDTSPEIKE